MKLEPLLFMVHRIPYPPNKGDKIRSFNMLRWLSKHYEVHLGCFIDTPEDKQYIDELQKYCASYKVVELKPLQAKIKSLASFIDGSPITLTYFSSKELASWVKQVVDKQSIQRALMFSSSMGPYLEDETYSKLLRVLDLVDVDSDKWHQYAQKANFPMSWIYHRESVKLGAYEKKLTQQYDSIALVSEKEAELFRSMVPDDLKNKVHAVTNGVDSEYFSPESAFQNISLPAKTVVFTGAMDYWANEEAVVWFCKKVWPEVLKIHPDACFYIVGTNPNPGVLALNNGSSVVVTGRVEDVRPYLDGSAAVVAPLRIARGIQNKVLEALSIGKVVVGTTMAFEGIEVEGQELDVLVADDAIDFGNKLANQLTIATEVKAPTLSQKNRKFVTDYYNWDAKLDNLTPLLEGGSASCSNNKMEMNAL
ncbi:MAG: hypothetical protein COA99_12945 [Moraxellaceae bacterium]|nr:MAG: hypothetical protein COA99_12945 [Moraxellaceae bacterium]